MGKPIYHVPGNKPVNKGLSRIHCVASFVPKVSECFGFSSLVRRCGERQSRRGRTTYHGSPFSFVGRRDVYSLPYHSGNQGLRAIVLSYRRRIFRRERRPSKVKALGHTVEDDKRFITMNNTQPCMGPCVLVCYALPLSCLPVKGRDSGRSCFRREYRNLDEKHLEYDIPLSIGGHAY